MLAMSEMSGPDGHLDAGGLEAEFEALRHGRAPPRPASSGDTHDHANGHFAAIYESREERFAATVPFVRQGLRQGEQCIYVLDAYSEAEVTESLRAGGVDVDDARETGLLRFLTPESTYLRERPFDPEQPISLFEAAIEEANADYGGLRVVSGTDWIDDVPVDAFLEYEGRANALLDETDAMALCLYDRTEHPPEVIRDVIRTHPHLVYDGHVSENFYYTPADGLGAPDAVDREVDRQLGTLNAKTRARSELAEHKRFLHELNKITARPDHSFEEKLQALFDLGCEWFDLELGALNRVDPDADWLQVQYINGEHPHYRPGAEFPLSETYCMAAADIKEAASVSDPAKEGYGDLAVYEEFGVESYLGTYIPVEGDDDRTFAFIAAGPRSEPFSEDDRTYLELMGQWVKYELERQQSQQALEETIARLQRSNDRLQQFAYAASHDLQEPLRMVSTYLQLLESRYMADLDEEAQEYIDFAVDGADRMRAMVDDLLAFTRVEQPNGAFESVDVGTIVERVTDDLQLQIAEQDAEIAVDSLPSVTADEGQLELLFNNLMSNALKYSGDDPPHIEITAERRGDRWEFAVADDGIGIAPERTDRIFEVFKRLHPDDQYSGTGIGLSLCEKIVQNHGGDIWVESEPGRGSTFYFTLPGPEREGTQTRHG